jgi:hypothetical protein
MMSDTLEQRIATAFAATDITSDDIAGLVIEVDGAILAADKAAEAEREKALDPIASPDATKARDAMLSGEFARDRLRTVLPRLQARYEEVTAAEYQVRWQADYEAVKAQHDALTKEYAELYPQLTARLCDLFQRAEAIDAECSRINGEAPAGEHRRLLGVELTARKLAGFSTESPSIAKELKLPDFECSAKMAWPPPRPSLAAMFAMSMVPPNDPRYTADWAAALEKENARRAANEARRDKEEAERQAQSRLGYEASLRR